MTSKQIQHLAILLPLVVLWVAIAIHAHSSMGLAYRFAIPQGIGFAVLVFILGYATYLLVARPIMVRILNR